MVKIRIVALFAALSLVLMGASECNIGGKSKNESCNITARDNTTITMVCENEKGKKRTDTAPANVDEYPNCQVGTYWPGCKGKGGKGGN